MSDPEEHRPAGEPHAVDTRQVSDSLDARRTIIGGLITVAVLAVVFVGVIPKFGSYSEAWAQIQQLSGPDLVAIGLSLLVTLLVFVWPYTAAIPGLRYRPAFVIRQTSFTISNAVPAGGAFGLALQYAMLASYSVGPAAATAGIAVTSLWSVLVTLTLPVMGVLAALTTGRVEQQWVWVALIGVAATVVAVVGLWLILRSERSAERVGSLGERLVAPVNRRRTTPLDARGMVLGLRHSTVEVLSRRWLWVTAANYVVVLAQFAILWFAIRGVGGTQAGGIALMGAFAAFAISRMGTMIPLTPGGLGTVDAALIALLVTFGLPESVAIAATLVWRAASFIPQVCLGIVTFVAWRVRQARAGGI